jgi:hypothetical protein
MRKIVLTFLLSLSLLTVAPAFAAPQVDVTNNEIVLYFPETAAFRVTVSSASEIQSVVLEYGNEQQTCGEVIAKAFPQISPGKTVSAEWTWDMRQSGSLPPGSSLWWRWHITDANGNQTVSETKTATWLDNVHKWQVMNNGEYIRLHWYKGSTVFATTLAKAAYNGLQFNETQSGLKADAPIDIYIYGSNEDLKDAILYEPAWTGGQAFPEQNIIILGISENDLEWGQDSIVHELTHVLVGHLTFSCLGSVPTWLDEGLAVFSEPTHVSFSQDQLDEAIRSDTLFSVRSLNAGFSELPGKATLSYSQSYSIVKFLIETYGRDKMTALLVALRDGNTVDNALTQVYGFDLDGLEDAWRAAVGAQPRIVSAQPTAQPTPTYVPTIVPVSGMQSLSLQVTPTAIPTSSVSDQPTNNLPTRAGPPLALTLILLTMCCVFFLIVGVLVLGFVVRRQNNKGGKNVQ